MSKLLSVIYRIHRLKVAGFTADLSIPGSHTFAQFVPEAANQARLFFGDGLATWSFASLIRPSDTRLSGTLLSSVSAGGMVQEIYYSIDVLAETRGNKPAFMSEQFRHSFPTSKTEGAVTLNRERLERWHRNLFRRVAFSTLFPGSPEKFPGVQLAQFED